MTKLAFLFGLLWPAGALACETSGLSLISLDQNAPRVEMSLENMQLAQPFSVKIEVCDDIGIKAVSVDAIMPAHQHGLNYSPTVVNLGKGVFRVDGLLFHMPGVWEIQVALTHQTGVTRYTQTTTLQ